MHPDDIERVDSELTKARTNREPFDVEFRILDGSGEVRWVSNKGAAACDESGQVVRLLGVTADITARKRAEDALRESEARFHTLADTAPLLCWEASADGRVTWCNQSTYDYTGAAPGELDGWGWQSICDPAMLSQVLERWRASLASGQPFEMVVRLRDADGAFRPFLARVAGCAIRRAWLSGGLPPAPTSAKRSEPKKRSVKPSNNGRWRSPQPAWEPGNGAARVPRSSATNGVPFSSLSGRGAGGVGDLQLVARVHPDDRDSTMTVIRQARAGAREGEYSSEFRFLWPNGSWHWVALQGQAFSAGEQRRR